MADSLISGLSIYTDHTHTGELPKRGQGGITFKPDQRGITRLPLLGALLATLGFPCSGRAHLGAVEARAVPSSVSDLTPASAAPTGAPAIHAIPAAPLPLPAGATTVASSSVASTVGGKRRGKAKVGGGWRKALTI